jgi:hypothetical protein
MDTVVLDFFDYHFTRRELEQMGIGLHAVAAARVNRILRGESLRDIYAQGMDATYRREGIGETSLIVLAYCLAAADFNVIRWMGPARTLRGGVTSNRPRSKK